MAEQERWPLMMGIRRASAAARDERGGGLLELMIVVGIGAVLCLTAFGVLAAAKKQSVQAVALRDFVELVGEVKLTLGDRNTCTRNLTGLQVSPGDAVGAQLDAIDAYDAAGAKTSNLLTRDRASGLLFISDLRFRPRATVSADRLAGDLMISARQTVRGGVSFAPREIPLYAKVVNGTVVECITMEGDESITQSQICELGNQQYDAATQRCVSKPVVWFSGSPTQASCPSGYGRDPYSQTPCRCKAPAGWTETSGVSRTYENGQTYVSGPLPYRISFDGATCNCIYAADVATSGWTAEIGCMQTAAAP